MHLTNACVSILDQLAAILHSLSDHDYCQPSPALSQSSIGQHVRHTVEFFICLELGLRSGIVNYDLRAHDQTIESNRQAALEAIGRIRAEIAANRHDRPLVLELSYTGQDTVQIATNYWRELTYNIEHAVHHMALLKIGVREIAPHVTLPPDFGVASSTLRHKAAEPRTQAA